VIIEAFQLIGGPEPEDLFKALDSSDDEVRMVAVLLVPSGENDPRIIRALAKVFQSSGRDPQTFAFWALCRCGSNRRLLVPELTRLLASPPSSSQDPSNRRMTAVTLLGQIGPEAASAVPNVRRLLNDPDPKVQMESAAAIWLIAHDDTMVRRLTQLLSDTKDASIAGELLVRLGWMGRSAAPAIPTILAVLDRAHDMTGAS
jgi:HEAT repeat protein